MQHTFSLTSLCEACRTREQRPSPTRSETDVEHDVVPSPSSSINAKSHQQSVRHPASAGSTHAPRQRKQQATSRVQMLRSDHCRCGSLSLALILEHQQVPNRRANFEAELSCPFSWYHLHGHSFSSPNGPSTNAARASAWGNCRTTLSLHLPISTLPRY